jgi:hypothetical protein
MLEQHPQLVRLGDDASIRGDGVGLGGGEGELGKKPGACTRWGGGEGGF